MPSAGLLKRLNEEWARALRAARSSTPLVEPTEAEKKNGWTAEKLTDYIAERKAATALQQDPHSAVRTRPRNPRWQNGRRLKWGKRK